MSEGPDGRRRVRISNDDREAAAQLLQQALVQGRITLAELDERLATVYAARYADELEPPFADLPQTPGGALPVHQQVALRPAELPATVRSGPPVADTGDRVVLSVGWGTLKRDGRWSVPQRLTVEVGAGTIVLDCTEAVVPPYVDLQVAVRSGTLKVILAPGMTADINGVSARSGSARSKVDGVADARYPHFVVRGTVGAGTVLVRRPRFGG